MLGPGTPAIVRTTRDVHLASKPWVMEATILWACLQEEHSEVYSYTLFLLNMLTVSGCVRYSLACHLMGPELEAIPVGKESLCSSQTSGIVPTFPVLGSTQLGWPQPTLHLSVGIVISSLNVTLKLNAANFMVVLK